MTVQSVVWSPNSGEPPVIRVSGIAEDPAWEAQLRLLNPTAGVMWVDLVPIGPALSAFPTHVGIRAGAAETVKLTVITAHLRRSGSLEHRLQLTWNIIPAPGQPLQGPARGTA